MSYNTKNEILLLKCLRFFHAQNSAEPEHGKGRAKAHLDSQHFFTTKIF